MTEKMWLAGAVLAGFFVGRTTRVFSGVVPPLGAMVPAPKTQAVQTPTVTVAPSGAAVIETDVVRTPEAFR